MKQIEIVIPDDQLSDALSVILEQEKQHTIVTKIHAGSNFIIIFRATEAHALEVLNQLSKTNILDVGQINLIQLELSKPEPTERDPVSRKPVEVIFQSVQEGNTMSADFVLYLIVAALIAGCGLATNNSVAVVAAMLVSPLMGPILAFSLAPLIRDWSLAYSGLRNESVALGIAVVLGFILGLCFYPFADHFDWPTVEMESRGDAASLPVAAVIAIASGVGVALAISSGGVNALVGVAISASLLPPAVNCGMCLAYGLVDHLTDASKDEGHFAKIGGISFVLVLVNIVCINVTAMAVFKMKAVKPFHQYSKENLMKTAKRLPQETQQSMYHMFQ